MIYLFQVPVLPVGRLGEWPFHFSLFSFFPVIPFIPFSFPQTVFPCHSPASRSNTSAPLLARAPDRLSRCSTPGEGPDETHPFASVPAASRTAGPPGESTALYQLIYESIF